MAPGKFQVKEITLGEKELERPSAGIQGPLQEYGPFSSGRATTLR